MGSGVISIGPLVAGNFRFDLPPPLPILAFANGKEKRDKKGLCYSEKKGS